MKRVVVWLLLFLAATAHAGRPCEERPLAVADVERAMRLADAVRQRLDDSAAQVVVIARVGQDLSRYGLHYSHVGFAYRDADGWRIVHKLNACGRADASLYRQGLGEFFLDRMQRYEAGFVVLDAGAQARLLPLLRDNTRVAQWHTSAYSMLAYPWSTRYQQSNQWALETLAGALDPAAATRARAQAWLQLHDYRPAVLQLDPLTRLGARMTRANVAFDDHPNEKRFSDRIETVSADSVLAWLQRSGLGEAVIAVH